MGEDTSQGGLAPVAAIKYTDDGTCLFVQADQRPENALELEDVEVPKGFYAIPVEVGTSSGTQIRILSGAEQGMTVFLGYQQSAPGGGDSTSQGDGTQQQGTGNSPSDFQGGGMGGGGGGPVG